MRTRIKICGITSLEDALFASECGVDALGFMFYEPSKRFVEIEAARRICQALPPLVSKVGVFVNASREQVDHTQKVCGLDVLQFHGEESPDWCQQFDAKTMKAFRVGDQTSLEAIGSYAVDAWLVDSYQPGERGGTGHAFQWDLLTEVRPYAKPLFLAGGLTEDNIQAAIREVQPFGVDVSSGVESTPGRKCPAKVASFVRKVQLVNLENEISTQSSGLI
ncbi:MAG: phosphoribosylanthranilate isomerase [Verrucomicrobia bacterium]|jgi:phosphoribosylanthranilate isomerase|nr:phosphoribosylanthranilate isomerase [Verrucomicrobiota bacterium]